MVGQVACCNEELFDKCSGDNLELKDNLLNGTESTELEIMSGWWRARMLAKRERDKGIVESGETGICELRIPSELGALIPSEAGHHSERSGAHRRNMQ